MRSIDADALKEEVDKAWHPDMAVSEIWNEIDEAPTIGGWVSVKDRLPDECGEYLIRDKMGVTIALLIDNEKGIWQWSDSDFYGRGGITHWMPLPEPPEEEKE